MPSCLSSPLFLRHEVLAIRFPQSRPSLMSCCVELLRQEFMSREQMALLANTASQMLQWALDAYDFHFVRPNNKAPFR